MSVIAAGDDGISPLLPGIAAATRLRDERWSALAPRPRSGGLSFWFGKVWRAAHRPARPRAMKIASWNINSVRARIGIVERFLTEQAPDILCLQETKAMDAVFPAEVFNRLGYTHQMLCGQPMHHGVAILSKIPLIEDHRHDWQDNGEARHIGARLPNGVRLENVYIPAFLAGTFLIAT